MTDDFCRQISHLREHIVRAINDVMNDYGVSSVEFEYDDLSEALWEVVLDRKARAQFCYVSRVDKIGGSVTIFFESEHSFPVLPEERVSVDFLNRLYQYICKELEENQNNKNV